MGESQSLSFGAARNIQPSSEFTRFLDLLDLEWSPLLVKSCTKQTFCWFAQKFCTT